MKIDWETLQDESFKEKLALAVTKRVSDEVGFEEFRQIYEPQIQQQIAGNVFIYRYLLGLGHNPDYIADGILDKLGIPKKC